MYLKRAQNRSGKDRLALLATAFTIIDQSEGNINEEDKLALNVMESKLFEAIHDTPSYEALLEELLEDDFVLGSYLKVRLETSLYSSKAELGGKTSLDRAYEIMQEALGMNPNHLPCLRMASQLHKRLFPNEWEDRWKLLRRRYSLEGFEGNSGLLFDLSLTACQLRQYHDAFQYLKELEEESTGHGRRAGIVAVIRDNGEDRRYVGEVLPIPIWNEGWIQCNEIGRKIKFVPVAQKFSVATGQSVTFLLALNYRGLLAINLRPT